MEASITYDVIIAGGGPGGSTTAAFLGQAGYNVLLLEKAQYPRDKTCGDAISGKSMGILRKLGLVDQVKAAPNARIEGVIFSAPNGKTVTIPFPARPDLSAPGFCCRRLVYDNILFQKRVQGVGISPPQVAVEYGLSGPMLRACGIQWDLRRNDPYSIYDRFEFDIPVFDTCDVLLLVHEPFVARTT